MSKKLFFTASAMAILAVFACSMPPIEIKSDKFRIGIPLRSGGFNIAAVIADLLDRSFPEGADFEIYDMVNFRGAQAFLVAYQMELTDSFNISDYIGDLDQDLPPIYPEPIRIPRITPAPITGEKHWFDMSAFFLAMEYVINTLSTPSTSVPLESDTPLPAIFFPQTLPLPPELADMPDFMAFQDDGSANFDSVIMAEGEIRLDIRLEGIGGGSIDPGINITLPAVEMRGSIDGNPIGNQNSAPIFLHSGNGFAQTVVVGLDSVDNIPTEIEKENPPVFRFVPGIDGETNITVGYTGLSTMVSFNFNLVIRPQVNGISLRGARGLKIGRMEHTIPQEIADSIKLDNMPPDMLNAQIGDGSLVIRATLPPLAGDPFTTEQTYCTGLTVQYIIHVDQAPVNFEGTSFEGLTVGGVPSVFSSDAPAGNLTGKQISGGAMSVTPASHIIIETGPDGADFVFFDNDIYDEGPGGTGALRDKSLPIMLDMEMEINRLDIVRWKLSDDLIKIPDIPDLDFGDMGGTNISRFIKSITFKEITLDLDFTVPDPPPEPSGSQAALTPGPGLPEPLRNRIAIRLNSPRLGFNNTTVTLDAGLNRFESTPSGLLELSDAADNPITVGIDIDIIPVIDNVQDEHAKYIELGPLTLNNDPNINNGDTLLNMYGEVRISFDWEEATVDLSGFDLGDGNVGFSGTFPPPDGDGAEKPINMYDEMGHYMRGLTFGPNIQGKVYISAPSGLIQEIKPTLKMYAKWQSRDPDNLSEWPKVYLDRQGFVFDNPLEAGHIDIFPQLPGRVDGQYVYYGSGLPPGGTDIDEVEDGAGESFFDVIASIPNGLSINYQLEMPTDPIPVTPEMFAENPNDTGGGIKVMFLVIIPLEFIAEPGATFSVDGVFNEDQDLFGRSSPDEAPFGDININQLKFVINFDHNLFRGARLHLEKEGDELLFPDGLEVNRGRNNSFEFVLGSNDWNIIRSNLIFPDVRLVYPHGSEITISRDMLPTSITIEASGSYIIDPNNF